MDKLLKNKKNVLREFNKEKYNIISRKKISKNLTLFDIDKIFYKKKIEYIKLQKENQIMKKFITKYSYNLQNIIDLGSGYGCRSIPLVTRKNFQNKKFYLFDIAPNAINLIKLLVKNLKIKNKKIMPFIWDFYNKKLKKNIPANSLIFTSYALVYRKKLNSIFLKNILNLKPRIVIHFEPIFEHNLKNKKVKEYFIKNNYSLNLLSILKKFQKMNKIKIIEIHKNVFGVNKNLPFSIIIWKKIN